MQKQKKLILMIDDEEDFCHFVKLNLEKTGKYRVLTALKGRDGIALAEAGRPDLVLLDIVMQDMDGGQVAWNLMNNELTKNIPIIFITAVLRPMEADQLKGKRHFLAKPVTPEKLMRKIDSALESPEKAEHRNISFFLSERS